MDNFDVRQFTKYILIVFLLAIEVFLKYTHVIKWYN